MPVTRILAPQLPDARQGIVTGDPVPDDQDANGVIASDAQAPAAQPRNLGPWLMDDEGKVAKAIKQAWEDQEPRMKQNLIRWDLNDRRREGDVYSKLVNDIDTDSVRLYTPVGVEYAPPSILKTDDLCEKFVAQLTADFPEPECEPSKDSDQDRDAAEFARRFLEDQNAESSLNVPELCDEAEDVACSAGSGFVWIYPDPAAGGPRPKTMEASPVATTVRDALTVEVPDPETGGTKAVPQPGPYTDRFVTPDGMLSDNEDEADVEWVPKLCGSVLSGRNVRFLPPTCRSLWNAEGVLIAAYTTLGDLDARFPEKMQALSIEQRRKLVTYKPPQSANLLPQWAKDTQQTASRDGTDGPPPEAPVLVMTVMKTAKGQYPKGCYIVMAGGEVILDRRPWVRIVTDPETQKTSERPNSIWLSQFRQFYDAKSRDPYGRGLVDKLIDGDPLIAVAIGALIDYVQKANNPHLFVPIGSGLSDKMLSLPRGTPLPYNAANGGKPVYEELGDFPNQTMELYGLVSERMDQRALLGSAVARGLDDPTAVSGKAKDIALSAAAIQMTRAKRGFDAGWTRTERIILEAGQMTFTAPQMIRVVGEDGAYKFDEFTSAKLGTTVDVRIRPGTGTLLNPSQKEQQTLTRMQMGILTPEQAQEQLRTHLKAQTGMEDDPALLRVKRQLSQWESGPPAEWTPPVAPQVMGVDPMGQPMVAPPPVDPMNPFADILPTDEEPDVARIRHYSIRRVVQGVKFQKKPPEWRQYLLDEYQRMRQAAGVMTVAEQAQAQQQAAAMEAMGKVSASAEVDETNVDEFIQAEKAGLAAPVGPMQQPQAEPQPQGEPSPAVPVALAGR